MSNIHDKLAFARHNPNRLKQYMPIQTIQIVLQDIPAPDGRPWYGLNGNPLKLLWHIARGDEVLCRGEVDEDGKITAKLRLPRKAVTLILRVGIPREKHNESASNINGHDEPEAEFEWFEEYQLEKENQSFYSEDVKKVQGQLNILGYLAGKIDGDMGPIATSALMSFQEDMHLNVTGTIDKKTMDALEQRTNKFIAAIQPENAS